jgi:uncharacterized protein (DUF58 family)
MGPLVASSGDPLGLFSRQKSIPGTYDLLVIPQPVDVDAIEMPADQLSGGALVQRPSIEASPSIAGLREYVAGDPMNHISWSATARRGVMMVKEFEPDPTTDIMLLLDLNDSSLRPLVKLSSLDDPLDSTEEIAVSVTASIAERALANGGKVGLIVNRSTLIRLAPDEGYRQSARIQETLAVAGSLGHHDLGETIVLETVALSRTTALVIVTATRETAWVAALRSLTERRIPVKVVIIDDAFDLEATAAANVLESAIASVHADVMRYSTSLAHAGPRSTFARKSSV